MISVLRVIAFFMIFLYIYMISNCGNLECYLYMCVCVCVYTYNFFPSENVYKVSITIETYCHGVLSHAFLLSHPFIVSESNLSLSGSNEGVTGLPSLLDSRGKNPFSGSFQPLESPLHSGHQGSLLLSSAFTGNTVSSFCDFPP